MRRLHLASASERRLAWLEEKLTNIEISASALMFEEPKSRWGAPVDEQVEFTCVAKAEAAAREGVVGQMAGKEVAEIIVVSDTMVTDPDDPLMPMGKPEDGQHAMAMLLRLSGNRHRVWSSTALVYPPVSLTIPSAQLIIHLCRFLPEAYLKSSSQKHPEGFK